jgi:HTH-type transcriptional regulator/antitoxin HipB
MIDFPVEENTLSGEPEFLRTGRKLQNIKDELIGVPGTPEREQYDLSLHRKIISLKIREYRKQHHLTQTALGERIGVQKNQISKLERNPINVTLDTLVKVFSAMHIKVNLSFEAEAPPLATLKKAALFACLFVLTYIGTNPTSPGPQTGAFLWRLAIKAS